MLISFMNGNVGPMASGELTFARRLNVFLKEEQPLFLSTHSPLVMAALEDEFASCGTESNKWLDFDMNMSTRQVAITEPPFVPQGTAENWLRSPAFGGMVSVRRQRNASP